MQEKMQPKIHLLPEHIIDQIKAGEVIERPSTLIKEIIENSIDAKATKIELHFVSNGLELIHIKDNGIGINADDLHLAFCRHATSKIKQFEDIYHLYSYGFRGEALASIASISKITCLTKTKNTTGQIKINGAEVIAHRAEEAENNQTGTEIFIKDLFYNTPVRMKFIQSKTSEKNQIKKIINAFMLTHPHINFSVKWDDQDKTFYPARTKEDFSKRIHDVVFPKQKFHFIHIENEYDSMHFEIYLSKESSRGNAKKTHYILVNDRFIQDIQIHKIILNTAAKIWPEGETGHYIAKLSLPADEVDVNIHPNKTVIKFFRSPQVFSLVSSAIKQFLNQEEIKNLKESLSQEVQSLPIDIGKDDFKNIEYKQIDFTNQESVSNYLSNIHVNEVESNSNPTSFIVHEYENSAIIKLDKELYFLKSQKLLQNHLCMILGKKDLNQSSIPLLVSRPIYLKSELSNGFKDDLSILGFEIDQLEAKTIVVRTFPKDLQNFEYLKIIESIISCGDVKTFIKNISQFKIENIGQSYLKDVFYSYPKIELIQKEIMTLIKEKDLLKVYGK